MKAKIIVYYFENGVAAFRTLSSINDTIEIVGNRNNWPLFIDLAFEPELASSVCGQLSENPKFAYASKSFANANLPISCRVLHNRTVKILERDGFAILKYFGTELATDEEVFGAIAESVGINVQNDDNHELDEFLKLPLSVFEFSVRTNNVFAAQNCQNIGDLISLTKSDLLRQPNFGRKSLKEVIESLDRYGLKLATDADKLATDTERGHSNRAAILDGYRLNLKNEIDTNSNYHPKNNAYGEHEIPETMIKNFMQATARFDDRERNVIFLRAETQTLEEIAQVYGVTRERIRQIEAKAFRRLRHPASRWMADYWSDKLDRIFDRSILPVTVDYIASVDECFFCSKSEKNLLGYIISTCCWGKFQLVVFNGDKFVSRISQKTLNEAELLIKNLVAECLGKSQLEIESLAKNLVHSDGHELVSLLVSDALKYSMFEEKDGDEVLSTYSERRSGYSVAQHIMRNTENPLKNEEIEHIIKTQFPEMDVRNVLNRFHNLEDVFPLRHGVWAKIKHLGFSDYELGRLKDEIQRAVASIDKVQFHSQDILAILLNNGFELSGRLDGFKLAGLIRNFRLATYLGRSSFTKDQKSTSRLLLHDIVVSVLRESGQPLKTSKIRDQVRKVRGTEEHFQVNPRPPIVALGKGYFALDHWAIRKEGDAFFRETEDVEEKSSTEPDNRASDAPEDFVTQQVEPQTFHDDQNNLENIVKIQKLLKAEFLPSQISEILKVDISEVQRIMAETND